jgi:ribosomal protein L31E
VEVEIRKIQEIRRYDNYSQCINSIKPEIQRKVPAPSASLHKSLVESILKEETGIDAKR